MSMSVLDQQTPIGPAVVLTDGTVVTARPATRRDLDQLHALAAHQGVMCDDLELARLLRSDPARRSVLCLTTDPDAAVADAAVAGAVVAGAIAETVIGVGVIELHSIATLPTMVLVDPAYGAPLAEWLVDVLVQRARAAA
jgi:hypothetical protein